MDPTPKGTLTRDLRLRFWLGGFLLFLALLYLLRSILLPFVAGMAIAYLLDPLALRMQRWGMSRTLATVTITLAFFFATVVVLVLLAPILQDQLVGFVQRVPGYVSQLIHRSAPLWRVAKSYLSPADIQKLRASAGDYAGTVIGWVAGFLGKLLTGSLALVNLLSLIFITPLVTFYFMRDWSGLTRRIDELLPRRHAATIRLQLQSIDRILSGWVRGQTMVCLALGVIYGAGLTAVGLDLGLVVGLGAGVLSVVPYLGTFTGLVVGIGLALAQSQEWTLAAEVAGVFIVGHLIEGNVLAPRLVGDKIGLHPVWVIFALLAGGALFGFLGIMLALPTAAVIGVLIRFAIQQYLHSTLYSDGVSPG
jgi:predicted PurR-regulated permease PerM